MTDLFEGFVVYDPIQKETNISVRLVSVAQRPNPNYNPEDPKSIKGFIDFNWSRISDGCPIRDSRQFPVGVKVLFDELMAQGYEKPSSNPNEFIKALIESERAFTAWIEERESNGIFYRNLHFSPMVAKKNVIDTDKLLKEAGL